MATLTQPTQQGFGARFAALIRGVFSLPETWLYLVLWGASAAILLSVGQNITFRIVFALGLFLFALITVLITQNPPPIPVKVGRGLLYAQIAVVLFFIFLTGYDPERLFGGQPLYVPIWAEISNFFSRLGEQILVGEVWAGPSNMLRNPAQYMLIPGAILLLLGARPGDMGFRRGHRVLWVLLLWCAIPVLIYIAETLGGGRTPVRLLRSFLGHFFQNGFFEEFLFRGVLLVRLMAIMKPARALIVQGVLFGLWHLAANTGSLNGDMLAGAALCIVGQSVGGIVYGVIFLRTRNLLAPSIVHVVLNMLG